MKTLKKLTIGSMKYNPTSSTNTSPTVTPILQAESVAMKVCNKIMEIEQDHIHYQLEVKSDQTILEAAFEQGVDLDYKCQKGTCGRCKVKVVNGRNRLYPANHLEENKLVQLLKMGFRLACQAKAK
jgi:ferredoxin, 2Fe-2S